MFEIQTLNEALRLTVGSKPTALEPEYDVKYSEIALDAKYRVFPEMIRTAELYLSESGRDTRSNDQRRTITGILFVLLAVLIYSPIISVGLLAAGALCFAACYGPLYVAGGTPQTWNADLIEYKDFRVSQGEQLGCYQFGIDHNLRVWSHTAALYWTGVVVGMVSLVAGETAWMWLG